MEDLKKTIRRNKHLGMWAVEKLRLTGGGAEAISDVPAVGTIDLSAATCSVKFARTSTLRACPIARKDPMRLDELMLQAGKANARIARRFSRCRSSSARAILRRDDAGFDFPYNSAGCETASVCIAVSPASRLISAPAQYRAYSMDERT